MTSVMAIAIPTVLIVAFAAIYITLSSAQIIDFPSASQVEYSTLSQLQWSQAVTDITEKLVDSEQNDVKLKKLENIIGRLEKTGALIYITKNGEDFIRLPIAQIFLKRQIPFPRAKTASIPTTWVKTDLR